MFSIGWIGDCAEGTDSRRVARTGNRRCATTLPKPRYDVGAASPIDLCVPGDHAKSGGSGPRHRGKKGAL